MTNYAHAPTSAPPLPPRAASTPTTGPAGYGRLIAWFALVLILAGLSFTAQAASSDQPSRPSSGIHVPAGEEQPTGFGGRKIAPPADDTFYRYSFALVGIVYLGILLGLLLLIARGLPPRPAFALYRPKSWPRTLGLTAGILVAAYVLSVLVGAAIGPAADTDQGIPEFWDGSRAPQFALNFIVVAALVPIVEELTFRGLGFSLLSSRFGPRIALAGTTLLFALGHGFLIALPLFLIAGLALGWLRMRTGSVYPGMLMHGAFNGCVTLLAVTLG